MFGKSRCFFLIFPLLGPEVAKSILLRPLYPGLYLLTAEEGSPAGLVVGDAVEVEPAADEFNLWFTRNHLPLFVDFNLIFLRAEGAVQDRCDLEGKPAVDGLQLLDDAGQNCRNHGHIDLLHTGYLLLPPKGCVAQYRCASSINSVLSFTRVRSSHLSISDFLNINVLPCL